jgi:hypothetical protein
MPTYLLIKCSGVSPVLGLNTAGFVSRSCWDILCSICVMGVRTTSTAAWVNWPLKKIWADHLICSMTAHNVMCGGVHACSIANVGCPLPRIHLKFMATMMFWTLIREEDISWRQISGKLHCSLVHPCTDFPVRRLSTHDYGWKWEMIFFLISIRESQR